MVSPFTRKPIFRRGSSSLAPSYWRGSRTAQDIPNTAILDEEGTPILSEDGDFILSES